MPRGGTLFSAQIAIGRDLQLMAVTESGLMNMSTETQSVQVSFFDGQGQPFRLWLAVPGGSGGEGSEFTLSIPPGGTLQASLLNCLTPQNLRPGDQVRTGYARFQLEDPRTLEIDVVFLNRSAASGRGVTAVGVPVREANRNWFLKARLDESYSFPTGLPLRVDAGVAVANPHPSSVQVEVTLLKPDGTPFDSRNLELAAGEQIARFVTELFPHALASGIEVFRVGIRADRPVALLALRADVSEQFLISGIPVLPLPDLQ